MASSDNLLWMQNPDLANAMRRRQEGAALMRQGVDSSPIQSPWQGVSRLAQALLGGYEARKGDEEIKGYGEKSAAEMSEFNKKLGAMMGGGGAPAQAPAAAPVPGVPGATQAPLAPPAGAAMPQSGSPDLMGLVAPIAQKYGVPLEMALGLFKQESSGNPNAVGDGGQSVGLGQIQAATARDPGYGVAPMDPNQRNDPAANADFAMRYLVGKGRAMGATDLTNPEHQAIALRAYNGGGDPNYVANVQRQMPAAQGQGAPPAPQQAAPQQRPGGMDAQTLQALAMEAQSSANPQIRAYAPMLMQQAQMAQRMALQQPRAPEALETVRDPRSSTGYRLIPRGQAGGMEAPEPRPMVSIQNSGESAFEKDRASTIAKRVGEWEDATTKSAQTITRLNRMEALVNDFSTGRGSQTAITAGQLAQRLGVPQATMEGLGIDPARIASGEAIGSLASQMLVGMIGSGGFPAQGFSNADREMLERALPGLGTSPGGNRAIIAIMKAGAQRDLEIGRAWRDWSQKNGDNLASVRSFQTDRLPQIVEKDIVAPILEDSGWQTPTAAPAAGGIQDGMTATNPQTGQKLIFRGGKWGPAQ